MGYNMYLSARSIKVGPYGAQKVMMALWLAAYAASELPQSEQVSKVLVDTGRENSYRPMRRSDVKALIEDNEDGCTWVGFDQEAVYRSRWFAQPTCPDLRNLVDLLRVYDDWQTWERIPAPLAAKLAGTMEKLLPALHLSCWFVQMHSIWEVFDSAKENGEPVHYG